MYENLNLRTVNIKAPFLHDYFQEDAYMHQPEGYVFPNEEHKVCKKKKTLYGLKQAARAWNSKIHQSLSKLGFHQSSVEKCLSKQIENDKTTYV